MSKEIRAFIHDLLEENVKYLESMYQGKIDMLQKQINDLVDVVAVLVERDQAKGGKARGR